jgi:hypothetical protein
MKLGIPFLRLDFLHACLVLYSYCFCCFLAASCCSFFQLPILSRILLFRLNCRYKMIRISSFLSVNRTRFDSRNLLNSNNSVSDLPPTYASIGIKLLRLREAACGVLSTRKVLLRSRPKAQRSLMYKTSLVDPDIILMQDLRVSICLYNASVSILALNAIYLRNHASIRIKAIPGHSRIIFSASSPNYDFEQTCRPREEVNNTWS